ncbi:MAG: VWA domain-containing protein [bacterium]|nr:VWA domain-containing protein [bacterium]
MTKNCVLLFALTLMVGAGPSWAENGSAGKVILVLDASGSMWGQIDGRTKIEIARDAVAALVGDWKPDIHLGLMVYGHRRKGDCQDIETVLPVGPIDLAAFTARVNDIHPKGKTPLSAAVRMAAEQLEYVEERASVILLSDGLETCEMDPCKLASELKSKGVDFKVHVIGFDIAQEEQAQLECLAKNTGGIFLRADNATGLHDALVTVEKVVEEEIEAPPPPPPPPPAPPVAKPTAPFFRDDFDGMELGAHWEVLNPDDEGYIVESGELLLVSTVPENLGTGITNLIRLTTPLPKGDWVATMKMALDYQTGRENAFLGLHEDKQNFMTFSVRAVSYYEAIRGARLFFVGDKLAKGKAAKFENVIWGGAGGVPFRSDQPPNPVLIRITKTGRTYTPAVRFEGVAEPTWVEHEKFTSLRQNGGLAFGLHQYADSGGGETSMTVDWVEIDVK